MNSFCSNANANLIYYGKGNVRTISGSHLECKSLISWVHFSDYCISTEDFLFVFVELFIK